MKTYFFVEKEIGLGFSIGYNNEPCDTNTNTLELYVLILCINIWLIIEL